MDDYLPILILLILGFLFAALSFVASALLAPRKRPTAAKTAPYECGIVPGIEPPTRFPVRFYLIAMIFIIFDIEIVFLYPWAVIFRQLGSFGLVEVVVFAAVVFISFLFLVSNGALSWGPAKRLVGGHALADLRVDHRPHHRRTGGSAGRSHAVGPPSPTDPLRDRPDAPRPASRPRRRARPGRVARETGTMGLEDLQHNFLTGRLEDLVKWARTYSMWPATFGLACCAIEMMSVGAADFDLARFGMEVFRASPRQADLMIVAGRVSQKMAPVLRQVYDQMMEPKWVLSMGVCASTGGMFNNYAIVQGVDQIVPVDVYAPGCPPTPETLMHAILTLHEKVRTNDITHRTGPLRPTAEAPTLATDEGGDTDDGPDPGDEATSGWTPDRPDAVHLGTPKRNPVIARSVGEPL